MPETICVKSGVDNKYLLKMWLGEDKHMSQRKRVDVNKVLNTIRTSEGEEFHSAEWLLASVFLPTDKNLHRSVTEFSGCKLRPKPGHL